MNNPDDLYTMRYLVGLLLPLLLVAMAVWSIANGHSFIPFIGGRFAPREVFGLSARLTGLGYCAAALFFFSHCFTPFTRKYENTALTMKCASAIVAAILFVYLFFATA